MSETEINMRLAAIRFLDLAMSQNHLTFATTTAAAVLLNAINDSQDAESSEQEAKETKP